MKGLFCLGIMIVLVMMSMNVPCALGITSLIMMASSGNIPWNSMAQQMVTAINSFTMLALPLFLLAGNLMNEAGITRRLFRFANVAVGWLPGGLAHVNVLSSMLFAGMSGTAVADAGGLGAIEIKAMRDAGFDEGFTGAVTAASSLLGPMIPPSVPLVMYALAAGGLSIGALFMATLVPGILFGLLLMGMIAVISAKRKYPRGKVPTLKELLLSFLDAILPMLAPVIILLGIYTGWFTATESAAIVVLYSLLLGCVIYREFTLKDIIGALMNTLKQVSTIAFLIAVAGLFGHIMLRTMLPQQLMQIIQGMNLGRIPLMLMIVAFLFIMGMFMDTNAIITIMVPIFIPLLNANHIDLIYFGVVLCISMGLGALTPPYGIITFVTAKLMNMPVLKLSKELLPFMLLMVAFVILIIVFPDIILVIPRTLGISG